MSSPGTILENIKNWINETGKLSISPYDNPKAHFSIWVKLPNSNELQPIMVTYPKSGDKILFGWNWLLEDVDQKAYHAIRDKVAKENLTNSFRNEAIKRNFLPNFSPDIYNLEGIAIFRYLSIEELTKDNFRGVMNDLMFMWRYLMTLFEKQGMNKDGFKPSDYI